MKFYLLYKNTYCLSGIITTTIGASAWVFMPVG